MSSYAFRIRVVLPDTMRIESEEETIQLRHSDTGRQLTLSAVEADEEGSKRLMNARHLAIKGGVYETSAAAMEAGRKCQYALMLAFTRMRLGANFGQTREDHAPKSVITQYGLRDLERRIGQRVLNDVHGMMAYDADTPTQFARSSLELELGKPPDQLARLLHLALECEPKLDDRELLAFELFGASFFERSVRTRFLTLMIALEALLEPKHRKPLALKHVQSLIEITKKCTKLGTAERESLLGGLEWLLKESINQTGREMVTQRLGQRPYYDMTAAKFFTYCYDLRSRIVHTGYSGIDINKAVGELEKLVSDFLCAPYFDLDTD